MTEDPAARAERELEEARARLHQENMAAIRAARAAVDEFTAQRQRRIRCPACDQPTIVVRGLVARHQPRASAPFDCPGSGAPAPPKPEEGGGNK